MTSLPTLRPAPPDPPPSIPPSIPMTSLPPTQPPTPTSYILATAIICLTGGYFLGQASSLGIFSSSSSSRSTTKRKRKSGKSGKESWPNSYNVTIHPDSSDEELMTHLKGGKEKKEKIADSEDDEDKEESKSESESESEASGELSAFPGNTDEPKLVLVIRTDLGMSKGKIAAQASHATLACYNHFLHHAPHSPLLKRWQAQGQAKIALQVGSEEEMEELQARAVSLGLCARVVRDAGRTQVKSGSATVLGVGPGPRGVVDGVTGGLRLL